MKRSEIAWMSCVLLAAACSERPKVPDITAAFVSFDQVMVTWNGSAAGFTNLVVEGRTVPGAFHALKSVAGSQQVVTIDLPPDTPELSDLEFRMTGVASDGTHSSNVASLGRGVRPSTLRCDVDFHCWPGSAGFHLYWQKESRVADRYVLTRHVSTLDGSGSGEVTIPIAGGATEAFDADVAAWVDGATQRYSLTAYKDETPSETTHVESAPAALNAPLLSGESTTEGVVVTIENRSRYALAIDVFRKTAFQDSFTLLAQTSAPLTWRVARLVDPGLAPGIYLYKVRVVYSSVPGYEIESNFALLWMVVSASSPATLAASRVDLVPGFFAARGPDGTFSIVTDLLRFGATPQEGRAVVPDGRDGSNALILPSPLTVSHVVVDREGRSHAVYADVPPGLWDGSAIPIVHAWYDGLSWTTEEIGIEAIPPGGLAFDIGPDGTLHAAWLGPQRGAGMVVGVATSSNGAWQVDRRITDVSVANFWKWDGLHLAGDETGAPHLILQLGMGPLMHFFRDRDGWHFEDVPQPSDVQLPIALLAGGARLTFLTDLMNATTRVRTLTVLERSASGWSNPTALADDTHFVKAARSADGQRVSVAMPGAFSPPGPGTLWIREADGTTQTYEWFGQPGDNVATGFSANGKAWVLDWLENGSNWPPGPTVPAVLFEER